MGLPTFDHYNSFLEISFAINVLFSAWNGWLREFLQRRNSLQEDATKLEVRVAALAQQKWDLSYILLKILKWMYGVFYFLLEKFGRSLGGLIAFSIALALFYLRGNTPVCLAGANLILLSGALLPALAVIVLGTEKSLSWGIRKKERRLFTQEENVQLREELEKEKAKRREVEEKLNHLISPRRRSSSSHSHGSVHGSR